MAGNHKKQNEERSSLDIRVTFKNNDFDRKLYDDIMEESNIIGKAQWMKLAAYEKLERDRNKVSQTQTITRNTSNPVIQSLDQMFKSNQ